MGFGVFHYFYTRALGALFVCVCVGGKCGVEKKLGYILNNFRPSLLDFEGFFCKPKELLETSVDIFSLSLLIKTIVIILYYITMYGKFIEKNKNITQWKMYRVKVLH